jgi:hypothetical protein
MMMNKHNNNHWALAHGNLTAMNTFQSICTWSTLKDPNKDFFKWLKINKVFLNQTQFKTDMLVPCGFLLGAHPGHLQCDEAKQEMWTSLNFEWEEIPFQLSARTVSVPIQDRKPE